MSERNLATRRNLILTASLAVLMLALVPVSMSYALDPDHVHMQTKLSGPEIHDRQPQGTAVYNANEEGRSFFVAVQQVPPEESKLKVTVVRDGNSILVGSITLSEGGSGQLLLTTRAGDRVPVLDKGDMVVISGTDDSTRTSAASDDARIEVGVF